MDEAQLKDVLQKYKFYHVIQLTETLFTPGWDHLLDLQKPIHRFLRGIELKGKRFLDIGCRDGLFSFEAEKLGAKEVIGIDNDLSPAAIEFLIPYFNSKVQFHELNLLHLTPEKFGLFDVVLFAGVLYHLRYPFWALKMIRDVLNEDGLLIIETGIWVDSNQRSLLFCPIGNESPYEPTSCTFFNIKGLIDTLFSLGLVVEQIELLNVQGSLELLPPKLQTIEIAITNEKVERLSSPQVRLNPAPESEVFDRVTLVCRKRSDIIDWNVMQYWDGTHKVHDTNKLFASD